MKIGILTSGFNVWGGGIDFIRHILTSIELADSKNIYKKEVYLPKNDLEYYARITLSPIKQLLKSSLNGRLPDRIFSKRFDQNYFVESFSDFKKNYDLIYPGWSYEKHLRYIEKSKPDIILPAFNVVPEKYSIPWVGYIYDFQHKYYPDFFSVQAINSRNKFFEIMLSKADNILVNSKSVADDVERFYAGHKSKIHVLPFSPAPRIEYFNNGTTSLKKYNIYGKYFIVSNQFWKHKDHITLFKAYASYVLNGGEELLVCTGEMHDARFPDYIGNLKKIISDLKISDKVILLGHIPKKDQIYLMTKSTAVIQPTLFEGGPAGGSGYDAIGLGLPLILSNIPVNMEASGDNIFYFKAGSPESLELQLELVAQTHISKKSKEELLSIGLQKQAKCGEYIIKMIAEILK